MHSCEPRAFWDLVLLSSPHKQQLQTGPTGRRVMPDRYAAAAAESDLQRNPVRGISIKSLPRHKHKSSTPRVKSRCTDLHWGSIQDFSCFNMHKELDLFFTRSRKFSSGLRTYTGHHSEFPGHCTALCIFSDTKMFATFRNFVAFNTRPPHVTFKT